jgi:hypothetical protein
MLEEFEDRGIDVRGPLLLSPMAAPFQHHGPTQLRNESPQIGDQLLDAAEGNHKIAIAGDIERRDRDARPGERPPKLPIAIDVAIPIEATAKSGARKFAGIER